MSTAESGSKNVQSPEYNMRHLPDNEIIGISIPLFEQRQPDRFFRLFFMGVSGLLGQTFEREAKESRQNNR